MILEVLVQDPSLPVFPCFALNVLVALMDVAHATDLEMRRFVLRYLIMYARATVTWKSRLQSVVSTSLTSRIHHSSGLCEGSQVLLDNSL